MTSTQKTSNPNKQIFVLVTSRYIEAQSDPQLKRFVFSYTVKITNDSSVACQLIRRHWLITDSNRKVEEVLGEGVVGKQPIILPGDYFEYSSSAVMETEIGTMEGRYFLIEVESLSNDHSTQVESKNSPAEFHVPIPRFTLSIPRVLH
ncbi:protein ApaG [Arenicella chitinivorans]|uniref:Protein ApaG n=1 Tax=Arenicella chitinivorans TaxID=1329800 RepID=A0A918RYR5_9GAMM|nr:Co2+/Mg2+ efflux protein ApaG [Arenicella chitinivorans]GHA14377.1 protein ApaG [Arenicella chitinivorans]